MVIQACQICGKEFNITPAAIARGAGKYCSHACYSKARRGNVPDFIDCLQCGKSFRPDGGNFRKGYGKFCSQKCYMASDIYKNRKTRLTIYKFECKHCGKEFQRTGDDKLRNQYCSPECFYKVNMGENHWNWKDGISPLVMKIRYSKKATDWKVAVFRRDNYTCQATSIRGCRLAAHHLVSFAFLIEKHNITTLEEAMACEALWDIANGITWSDEYHRAYHSENGKVIPEAINIPASNTPSPA